MCDFSEKEQKKGKKGKIFENLSKNVYTQSGDNMEKIWAHRLIRKNFEVASE